VNRDYQRSGQGGKEKVGRAVMTPLVVSPAHPREKKPYTFFRRPVE